MSENKNNVEAIKGKHKVFVNVFYVIKAGVTAVLSIGSSALFFFISLFVIVATSITLLLSLSFNDNSTNAIPSDDVDQTIMNQCKADINDTTTFLRPLYLEQSKNVASKVKEYVTKEYGDELASSLDVPDESFLGQLKDSFGIDNGQANINREYWHYIGWEDTSKIKLTFNKSYQEIQETLYGYVSANIAAIDNFKSVHETNKKCKEEGNNCSMETLTEDDYDLECKNTEEGCSVKEIVEAMNDDKKETIKTMLNDQEKDENYDKVFYIDTTLTSWASDLKWEEFESIETKQGTCTVSSKTEYCPGWEDMDDYKFVSINDVTDNADPTNPDHSDSKKYEIVYTYKVIEIHEGLVGEIVVPIYLNVDEFLKTQKTELVELMTEDLTMSEGEAYGEIESYVDGAFEGSMKLCNLDIDYSIFGSSSMIGVENNGAIGDIDVDLDGIDNYTMEQLAAMSAANPWDPVLKSVVWGNIQKFGLEGKINFYNGGDWKQCTNFVAWMAYKAYGLKIPVKNGNQMAQAAISAMPDKFIASSEPAPGAIVSSAGTSGYGHVLFIHSVIDDNGDGIWDRVIASDGNIDKYQNGIKVDGKGINIMKSYTRQQWLAKRIIAYAVPTF